MHMALGTSGCFWLNQDSALALLSANRIQGKEAHGSRVRCRGLLSWPSSPTMLPSRGFKAFGDTSHPLLSCPISGPRGLHRGERGAKTSWGSGIRALLRSRQRTGSIGFKWLLGQGGVLQSFHFQTGRSRQQWSREPAAPG